MRLAIAATSTPVSLIHGWLEIMRPLFILMLGERCGATGPTQRLEIVLLALSEEFESVRICGA
jgi:hypothetical protein